MRKALQLAAITSFALYVFLLIYLLFINLRSHYSTDLSLADYIRYDTNLIPFKSIIQYISALSDGSMNIGTPVRNLFGNLIAFLPMGIYLPYFFKGLRRFGRYAVCMAAILIAAEAVQVLLRVGAFDIDDVILNIAGAFAGFAIFKIGQMIIKKAAHADSSELRSSESHNKLLQ